MKKNGYLDCHMCRGKGRVSTGEVLREIRIDAGMTQVQVARKIGKSGQYVSEIENGSRGPIHPSGRRIVKADLFAKICSAIGTGGEPEPTPGLEPVNAHEFARSELVSKMLLERSKAGEEKYGTVLMTFNGRNARNDLFDELLDAMSGKPIYGKPPESKWEHKIEVETLRIRPAGCTNDHPCMMTFCTYCCPEDSK